MPVLMIVSTVGFMFGTGGTAIVARVLGEGDRERANRYFSLFTYVAFGLGVLFSVFGILLIRPIAGLLGAEGELLDNCVVYACVNLVAMPFFILQLLFQSFFITAEKPQLGLAVTVSSGVTNMVLDAVLVTLLPQAYNLVGAALATAMSQLYNLQLIRYAGEDGIAAYGVMMYVSMIFSGAFIGYSIGTAPVIGYHYGAQNHPELRSLLRKSLFLIGAFGICMVIAAQLLASPLARVFVGYDASLMALTVSGFRIFALSFLFMGFAVFSSGFFTALSDGLTSALISFLRTMVFQVAAVLLLPLIWGINGVWVSIVAADFMAVILGMSCLVIKRRKYRY